MMCGSSRAFQKHIVLGVLEDVLGGLGSAFSRVYFLAGEAPADVSTPVGGCTESRARAASPPAVNKEAIISTCVGPQPAAARPRVSGPRSAAQARLQQPFPSVRRRGPHHAISSAAGVSGKENAGF